MTRKPIPGGAGFGSTTGLIRPGKNDSDGTIYLPAGGIDSEWHDAVGLVSEIFHLAGSEAMYYDYELAVAVHNIPEFAAKFPAALGARNNVFDPALHG